MAATAGWIATPSSFGGGIWQASQGPAADEKNNVYVITAKRRVKNLAAYTGSDAGRRDRFLWSTSRGCADLLQNGIAVRLNKTPANDAGWATAADEPQYLKLFDVTP